MTSTSAATVPLPTVEDSWARIDAWLSERAPASYALLRPPASPAEIADAERRLEVTFPPDLVASLHCHNGVVLREGAPAFAFNGPFSGLTDIVDNALFLRSVGDEVADEYDEEEDESELNAYWRHEWLLITQGVARDAQDGLFVTCRAGEDYGRIGRYFNEDAPRSPAGRRCVRRCHRSPRRWSGGCPSGPGSVGFRRRADLGGGHSHRQGGTRIAARPRRAYAEPEPAGPAGPAGPARGTPPAGWSGALVTSGLGKPSPQQVPQPDLVFAEGLSAEELLLRVGVVERETVRERTHAHAERAARSLWAASRPLVRAGLCGDWGFLTQSAGTKQLTRRRYCADSPGHADRDLTKQAPKCASRCTPTDSPTPRAPRTAWSRPRGRTTCGSRTAPRHRRWASTLAGLDRRVRGLPHGTAQPLRHRFPPRASTRRDAAERSRPAGSGGPSRVVVPSWLVCTSLRSGRAGRAHARAPVAYGDGSTTAQAHRRDGTRQLPRDITGHDGHGPR